MSSQKNDKMGKNIKSKNSMAKQVKDMNRQFILKGIQVTFKHVNVCKISLYCDHHKLKIHWNIIYQNVKNSKSNNTLCWINCWEICISHTLLVPFLWKIICQYQLILQFHIFFDPPSYLQRIFLFFQKFLEFLSCFEIS